MSPDRVRLRPGDRVRTDGRVKAPRHLVGEPRQHSLTVTARSRSAPSYAPATFHQRPLFPRSLRTLLAVVTVLAVWLAALGAGFWWWTTRDDEEPSQATAPLVDTDGDGIAETPGDQLDRHRRGRGPRHAGLGGRRAGGRRGRRSAAARRVGCPDQHGHRWDGQGRRLG